MVSLRRRTAYLVTLLLSAGLIAAAPAAGAAAPDPAAPAITAISSAVTTKLLDRAAVSSHVGLRAATAAETRVNITRRQGAQWAFGTAVIVSPREEGSYPEGWLFHARSVKGAWQIAFEGEAQFRELVTASPLTRGDERSLFAGAAPTVAGGDYRTGMALPYGVGQSWNLTSGPHGWDATEAPWTALDLAGVTGSSAQPEPAPPTSCARAGSGSSTTAATPPTTTTSSTPSTHPTGSP